MNKDKEDVVSRYRARARQLRALAEQIENEKDRKLLLAVADEYDQLAQTAGGGVRES